MTLLPQLPPYVIVCGDCAAGHTDVGHRTLRIGIYRWPDPALNLAQRCFTCGDTLPETEEVTGVWRLDCDPLCRECRHPLSAHDRYDDGEANGITYWDVKCNACPSAPTDNGVAWHDFQ